MDDLLAIIIIVCLWLIILWKHIGKLPHAIGSHQKYVHYWKMLWSNLTAGEKVQWLADTNFGRYTNYHVKKPADKIFLESITWSNAGCQDEFQRCKSWADNGECKINPEYMLYFCPKSCNACKLNSHDKYKLVQIWNQNPPSHCVYHGEPYPSNYKQLAQLYDINETY